MLAFRGQIVLPDRILADAVVRIAGARIVSVGVDKPWPGDTVIDLAGGFLAPGFVDLHVHGGDGHDFMDGTADAFRGICKAHARHGTTALLPTTTVARHDQCLAVLELCRRFQRGDSGGARVIGAHFYGPYFNFDARGAHPGAHVRNPVPDEYEQYLAFANAITTASVAAELPGAEGFVRACRARGVRCNVGHSFATFAQMRAAVDWGVRHIDHLFCAMSDRARLRLTQTYPMRGGVMEATLFFDELTTEIIADGKHLEPELLQLAYKIKGPDRLALVTDCNRALDMPDGPYLIGPLDGGEPMIKRDDVGLLPSGTALASSVAGMDHMLRTFLRLTGAPLAEVVRMASLTPARIAGVDDRLGSIAAGKLADLVVLDRELQVRQVLVNGQPVHSRETAGLELSRID
ncbi:MAG: N-acetylglucosamine-6-phosphate deacetylase [Planctomycetes bacterium]|nr:N-acetylglucosamine-6-phosphate deacetylase [Planctomycetota bacterium]